MTKRELAEKAVEYKHGGYNCAQAVIKSLSDNYNLPPEDMLKMTAGFAVGMGCMETTCGALVGANMITGIRTDGNGTVNKSRALFREFEDACGATICKDLKGRDTGKVICPCDDCVRNAVIAAMNILDS